MPRSRPIGACSKQNPDALVLGKERHPTPAEMFSASPLHQVIHRMPCPLILVSADGYKLPDGGQRTLTSTARFELTMTKVKGKWLASDLQSVGLI